MLAVFRQCLKLGVFEYAPVIRCIICQGSSFNALASLVEISCLLRVWSCQLLFTSGLKHFAYRLNCSLNEAKNTGSNIDSAIDM